ncbi:FixH family protein [Paenibacillus sp. ATY16]|uniref:FixH family protein n=1 Tax=Paenibacillus sp. ATY16 TaxID=1759312 RepID=UPI00200FDB5A|nr:FixH family protein [Paenibacillus sp. ATY16]MCK9861298.1 FixH family protein [Paenibacillus sp. ATY16]
MNNKRMKWTTTVIIAMMIILLAGCSLGSKPSSSPFLDDLTISMEDTPNTGDTTAHAYKLTIKDSTGSLVDVDLVRINMSMSMQGMNHKMKAQMERSALGEYKTKVYLPMNGDWRAIVSLKKDKHERKISLRL